MFCLKASHRKMLAFSLYIFYVIYLCPELHRLIKGRMDNIKMNVFGIMTWITQADASVMFVIMNPRYKGVSKSFRTESITKYTLTATNTR